MKTKKFFMLLAVVLLSGASAFAQSESETLKGDVNEDGVVDVADINAVIEIMKAGGGVVEPPTYYFSVGTTAPDASNYTTINNATTDIPTTTEFTNNSGSRTYAYILVPENKTVSVKDKNLGGTAMVTEYTDVSITNHKVYKTTGTVAKTGTIVITLSDVQPTYYYFYVGQSNPMDMTSISNPLPADNVVDGGWRSLGVTTDQPLPTYTSSNPLWDGALNTLIVGSSKATCYVALPSPNLKMRDSEGDELPWINLGEKIFNGVAYTIYESPMQTKVFNNIIF